MKIFLGFSLIKILGKRQRRVPVLLSGDTCKAIRKIISLRKRYVADDQNPHIYMLPGLSQKPITGWTALKLVTKQLSELQMPEAITSTNIRKYVATVSQVNLFLMTQSFLIKIMAILNMEKRWQIHNAFPHFKIFYTIYL